MRSSPPELLERGRIREGKFASTPADGMVGAFRVKDMLIMSSGTDTEYGWEHVSVSLPTRTPTWAEMCFVKDLFWREDEMAVQFHPRKADYVNHHPFCLHLWCPVGGEFPTPPSMLVGPKI